MRALPLSPSTRSECELALRDMQAASDIFYNLAQQTHVHAFLEFTGLMNEYILCCRNALAEGIDFRMANAHGGLDDALPMETQNFRYLMEKLNCIYGPSMSELVKKRLEG